MKKSSKKSKLTSRTSIPNLTGLTREQAESALTSAGLRFRSISTVTNYSSENQKLDSVTGYSTGQVIPRETEIEFVYKSYQGIAVPDCTNVNQVQAATNLTNAGLVVGSVYSVTGSNSALDGKISEQSVAAGTLVDRGTSVNLGLYTYVAPYYNPYSNVPPYGNTPPYDNTPPYGNTPPYDNAPPIDYYNAPPIDLPPINTGKSLGVHTLVRTPDGLAAAGSLNVGDVLISALIEGVPYTPDPNAIETITTWTTPNPIIEYTTTTITSINKKIGNTVIAVNGDVFSQYHFLLVKRDGLARFMSTADIVQTDLVYSYVDNEFIPITMLEKVDVDHEIVSINCEPYDIFFTDGMLVHDSVEV